MTLEVGAVAAGKAVVSAGAGLAKGDASERASLRELAKDSPALKAAAENYARRVAIRQGVLLRFYLPLRKWAGLAGDYFDTTFPSELAEKLADIPEDNLATPAPGLAIPAMQGLAYNVDEPDLKEMYLNLLATATDGRRQDEAHPAFVQVIKQLAPAEAGLLMKCLAAETLPLVAINRGLPEGKGGGYTPLYTHLMDWQRTEEGRVELPMAPVYVDNWTRLGLFIADYDAWLTAEGRYDWAEKRPELERLRAEFETDGRKVVWEKGVLRITDFGRRFRSAIAAPPEDPADSAAGA